MAWYTCINHVQVLGKPLYNFRPVPPGNPEGLSGSHRQGATGGTDNGPQDSRPQLVLEAVREDPMVARGGLMALSEGGMLLQRLEAAATTGARSMQLFAGAAHVHSLLKPVTSFLS